MRELRSPAGIVAGQGGPQDWTRQQFSRLAAMRLLFFCVRMPARKSDKQKFVKMFLRFSPEMSLR
jgi:hypothetical protein